MVSDMLHNKMDVIYGSGHVVYTTEHEYRRPYINLHIT